PIVCDGGAGRGKDAPAGVSGCCGLQFSLAICAEEIFTIPISPEQHVGCKPVFMTLLVERSNLINARRHRIDDSGIRSSFERQSQKDVINQPAARQSEGNVAEAAGNMDL